MISPTGIVGYEYGLSVGFAKATFMGSDNVWWARKTRHFSNTWFITWQ